MSSQVDKATSFKYSIDFLLVLQNRAGGTDPLLLESLRSHQLYKGSPSASDQEAKARGEQHVHKPVEETRGQLSSTKNQRNNRTTHGYNGNITPKASLLPLKATQSVPKKPMTLTPNPKMQSIFKENVVNSALAPRGKFVSSSVQKPLQTHKAQKPLTPAPVFLSPKKVFQLTPLPSGMLASPSETSSPESDFDDGSPSQLETDPHRLSQRQKQVTYGYRTLGYLRYRLLVPRDKRRQEHPRTPRKEQVCSKRSWDGQVKKWRRELHKWDPDQRSGFAELLTADILDSIFVGVPDITDLIKALKEKLAQGKLGELELEEGESPAPQPQLVELDKDTVTRTLVF